MSTPLNGIRILDLQIGSWSPTPDGSGPAEAVALNFQALWNHRWVVDLVLRLKSPRAVDELIAALQKQRADVWPAAPPAAHAACDEGGDEAREHEAYRYRKLIGRAISGLKTLGPFHYQPGDDPHALDCTLAGRVSRVFGLGMTLAIELCREFGHDPAYQEPHTIEEGEAP